MSIPVEYKRFTTEVLPTGSDATSDTYTNLALAGPTPQITPLFFPIQGSNYDERIGNKCYIKRLDIKLNIQFLVPGGSNYTNRSVRIMVVIDKNGTGTAPLITEVLAYTAGPGINAPRNAEPEYLSRFTIIADTVINSVFTPQGNPPVWELHKNMKGHRVNFDTANNPTQGSLWMIMFGNVIDIQGCGYSRAVYSD